MFQFSHYIDSKYSNTRNKSPPPMDESVITPMTAAVTYGNILFNDYKTEAVATQIMDIKLKSEGLQKERDFYYNKLRDIESLCRVMEDGYNDPAVSRILSIIYESQEIRKTKRKGKGRRKKNKNPEDDLDDFPPIDYPTTPPEITKTK